MTLNNWMQSRYGTTRYLSWEYSHSGSQDNGEWTAIVFCEYFMSFTLFPVEFYLRRIVNGIEQGRGTAKTKGSGAELAAYQYLVTLGVIV